MNCKVALQTILDQVDYTNKACRPNEMVAAVLPVEVIELAKEAIAKEPQTSEAVILVRDMLNYCREYLQDGEYGFQLQLKAEELVGRK